MSWPTPKEFYDRYSGDPEAARKAAYQIGREVGQMLRDKNGIRGNGLDAVAEVLNAAMNMVRSEPSARVDGLRVVKRNRGFCVIMRSALSLNIPWAWLDQYYAWPYLEGIVSIVRDDLKMRVTSARSGGDEVCTHVFEAA